MRLLLIRHGSTLDNEQQRYSGQADVPLSPLGESQVALLGQQLAHEPIDIIVTSDLQRARATGAAIAHYHQAVVYEDPAIREISLGAWEGLTFAELRERDPEAYYGWQNKPLERQAARWRNDHTIARSSRARLGVLVHRSRGRYSCLGHSRRRYPCLTLSSAEQRP